MTQRFLFVVSGRGRLFMLCLMLLLAIGKGYSQTGCNCPATSPTATCSPCAGGLTSLVVRWNGVVAIASASDNSGNLTVSVLSNVLTITKLPAGTPFDGNVTIAVTAGLPLGTETITTSCAGMVQQGTVIGNLTVVSGASVAGPLCCSSVDQDHVLPTITCPSGFDVYVVGGCSFVVPDYRSLANAADNCGVAPTITQSPAVGTVLTTIGTVQSITLTATDKFGNARNCSFNITLKDNIAPVITCPDDFDVYSDASCSFTLPDYTGLAIVNDNCGATVTQSPAVGTVLGGVGISQLITLTAKDGTGNKSSCSFTITVKDNIPPFISCSADFDVFTDTNCQFTIIDYTGYGAATDNCDANVTITQSPAIGTVISGSSQVITLTATDDSNNSSTCSFTITLKDNIVPVITHCPANVSLSVDANSCTAIATWTSPNANDNCGISSFLPDHNSGDAFPLGTTTVTYTAKDAAGNTTTCSFTVEVTDQIKPVLFDCPSDITVNSEAGCQAIVTWNAPTATDNCSTPSLVSDHLSGSIFAAGTTPVMYTATDASGNITTCSFNVIVKDLSAPVFSGCLSDLTITAETDCKTTVAWIEPTAMDDCSTATITSTHHTGDEFDTGTTRVVYTATDAAGNTSSCSFNVIVVDHVAPAIKCIDDVTVLAGNACGATVSWTAPQVTDCSSVTLTSSPAMGSFFSVGTTNVTYTATDASGNSSTCTFKVTVEDKTKPVFSNCITEIKAATDQSCKAIVRWTAPIATDNCGTPAITASHSSVSEFTIGTTQVTYTATDAAGNTSQCQFNVIVTDGNIPTITNCPADINLKANESGKVMATWIEPTTSVFCGTATLTSTHKPGDEFTIGANEVIYTSTSSSGITSTCSFFVNVAYKEVTYEVSQLITPNGDGVNDVWELKNIELFKDNKVTVVDRWGGVIYTATGYNNTTVSWNGMNEKGIAAPTGTYFYTITVKFRDTTVDKKGFVELVR